MMRQPDETSESRLEALRGQAVRQPEAANYPAPGPAAHSASTGYYGLPVLKPPVWTWEVPLYFFLGGMAGGSAVIALGARLWSGSPGLVRLALWIGFAAGLLCPALLVADLGRPARFLNMLRVWKRRSPMSVGAWALAVFTASAFAAALSNRLLAGGQAAALIGAINWAAISVAGISGLVLLSYTGVLLGVTAIPVWSENRGLLPTQFVASAIGSASALLELAGFLTPAMQRLGLLASGWETAVWFWIELRRRPVDLPLRHGSSSRTLRLGEALAGPVALALRLLAGFGSSIPARRLAAVCFLAGALLIRYGWLAAGRASASDPQALFDLQRRGAGG